MKKNRLLWHSSTLAAMIAKPHAHERRFQMDWDNIRIFLSVARAGQFSANEAADETRGDIFSCFGLTQSSYA
jgi:hypothetical protein